MAARVNQKRLYTCCVTRPIAAREVQLRHSDHALYCELRGTVSCLSAYTRTEEKSLFSGCPYYERLLN